MYKIPGVVAWRGVQLARAEGVKGGVGGGRNQPR